MSKKVTPQQRTKRYYIGALVATALFIGGGIGVVFTYAATKSSVPETDTKQATSSPNYYSVGQVVNKQGLSFSLNSVKTDTAGNAVFKPADQEKFIIADITVTNNTTSQIPVVPVTQIYLKDADGQTYYIAPAPVTNPLNAGNLPAGENLRGEISFSVPSHLTSLKLYYDPGWSNLTPSIYEVHL